MFCEAVKIIGEIGSENEILFFDSIEKRGKIEKDAVNFAIERIRNKMNETNNFNETIQKKSFNDNSKIIDDIFKNNYISENNIILENAYKNEFEDKRNLNQNNFEDNLPFNKDENKEKLNDDLKNENSLNSQKRKHTQTLSKILKGKIKNRLKDFKNKEDIFTDEFLFLMKNKDPSVFTLFNTADKILISDFIIDYLSINPNLDYLKDLINYFIKNEYILNKLEAEKMYEIIKNDELMLDKMELVYPRSKLKKLIDNDKVENLNSSMLSFNLSSKNNFDSPCKKTKENEKLKYLFGKIENKKEIDKKNFNDIKNLKEINSKNFNVPNDLNEDNKNIKKIKNKSFEDDFNANKSLENIDKNYENLNDNFKNKSVENTNIKYENPNDNFENEPLQNLNGNDRFFKNNIINHKINSNITIKENNSFEIINENKSCINIKEKMLFENFNKNNLSNNFNLNNNFEKNPCNTINENNTTSDINGNINNYKNLLVNQFCNKNESFNSNKNETLNYEKYKKEFDDRNVKIKIDKSELERILIDLLDSKNEICENAFLNLNKIIDEDVSILFFSCNSIISSILIQLNDSLEPFLEINLLIFNTFKKLSGCSDFVNLLSYNSILNITIDLIKIVSEKHNDEIMCLCGDILLNICIHTDKLLTLKIYFDLLQNIKNNEREILLKLIWKHSKMINQIIGDKKIIQEMINVINKFYENNASKFVKDDLIVLKVIQLHLIEICTFYRKEVFNFEIKGLVRKIVEKIMTKIEKN